MSGNNIPILDIEDINILDREEQDSNLEPPARYNIVMINDDYTSMDWVIHVLVTYFNKTLGDAVLLMLQVHEKGRGVAMTGLDKDIAVTKSSQVNDISQENGHPFRTEVEEV